MEDHDPKGYDGPVQMLAAGSDDGGPIIKGMGMAGGQVKVRLNHHIGGVGCGDDNGQNYFFDCLANSVISNIGQGLVGMLIERLEGGLGNGPTQNRNMGWLKATIFSLLHGPGHLRPLGNPISNPRPEILVGSFRNDTGIDKGMDRRPCDLVKIKAMLFCVDDGQSSTCSASGADGRNGHQTLSKLLGHHLGCIKGLASTDTDDEVSYLNFFQLGQGLHIGQGGSISIDKTSRHRNANFLQNTQNLILDRG